MYIVQLNIKSEMSGLIFSNIYIYLIKERKNVTELRN
jgi:hypothetical protein